ncbi:MAG: outer membrane protein assembly factor BamD [Bacteroidales bacterium]|nr:outer membrane protein assembly factor BamD [Bacteroidales bacterium]
MKLKKLAYILVIFLTFSCQSEYQKLLKSNDYEKQFDMAMSLFEKGQYFKAYTIFEQILPAFRLTEKGEIITFHLAKAYYNEKDYLMAAYYFERFATSYPYSEFIEEALFSIAMSYTHNSPAYSLDQTYTRKAISAFYTYLNRFPNGKFAQASNDNLRTLRGKLEQKAFSISRQYYNLSHYRAAVISLKNTLKEFPDIAQREEILFLIVDASYNLAQHSVEGKKEDRIEMAKNAYAAYVEEFPNGKWIRDVQRIFAQLQRMKVKE